MDIVFKATPPVSLERDLLDNFPKEQIQTSTFGVRYLDLATGGILPNDIVLVTARTGAGKTEFCTNIAMKNSLAGKRVLMFALEAEHGEIGKRMGFKSASRIYHADENPFKNKLTFRYIDFYKGLMAEDLKPYQDEIAKEAKLLSDVFVIYRNKNFSADDFCNLLYTEQENYDLFILDHLSYLELPDDAPENKALTKIIQQIRDMALITSKPVVLVSHLRKKDRKDKSIVPDIEDVYGSSNIYKIATKCIIIAPDYSSGGNGENMKTYFHIAKCRTDGSVTRYLGLVKFDFTKNEYAPDFDFGKYYPGIESFEQVIGLEIPRWVPVKDNAQAYLKPPPLKNYAPIWYDKDL